MMLVIGLGAGGTTRATQDAGFSHVTVAELSRDIATMARRHFVRANGDVLDRPNVDVAFTDGRTYLQLRETTYDLIVIELSSIWFAGTGSLYNREFYQIAKTRLAPGGVLEQWVQLHHIDTADLASILGTVRAVFPHVVLYNAGGQGIIVACVEECPVTPATVARLETRPTLAPEIEIMGRAPASLGAYRELDTPAIDALIAASRPTISTDDNMFLEYHTPRGNVEASDNSTNVNIAFLERFKSPPP